MAAELRNVYEDLSNHMMKEEHVLFPMIKAGNYMMAQMPIRMMEMEHTRTWRTFGSIEIINKQYDTSSRCL